jgi:hypothetical protein
MRNWRAQTRLIWQQLRETAAEFKATKKYAPEADEQNVDRLGVLLQDRQCDT